MGANNQKLPGGLTLKQMRSAFLKFEELRDQGKTHFEIAELIGIDPRTLTAIERREEELMSIPGPWSQTYKGKTWRDMPGGHYFIQRCNFALYRRGKFDPELFREKRRIKAIKVGKAKKKLKDQFQNTEQETEDLDLAAFQEQD